MARVLQLVGSPTSAFWADLSLLYARGAAGALGEAHGFTNLIVLPDETWRFTTGLEPHEIAAAPPCGIAEALARAIELAPDCVLPQMFCHRGMVDLRALFEAAGLPLLGNRAEVMAIGADKTWTKAVIAAAGIATPHAQIVHRDDPREELRNDPRDGSNDNPRDRRKWEPPFIVKPVMADNSDSVSLVTAHDELAPALDQAFAVSDRALIEEFVPPGREVRAGVVEIDGRAVPLPLEEYNVDPTRRPIRRAADKIAAGSGGGASGAGGGLALMAKTREEAWIVDESDPVTAPIQAIALACHQALGCRDYSLFDLRIDPEGKPWFLEAGLYCSFAPDSVIVTMMEAAGTPLGSFFARSVDHLRERRERASAERGTL